MSVRLLFANGTTMTAADPEAVLLLWGEVQWTPVEGLPAIQAALAERAAGLGHDVDPALPADEFLEVLDRAAILAVLQVADKAKPGVVDAPWRERYDPEG